MTGAGSALTIGDDLNVVTAGRGDLRVAEGGSLTTAANCLIAWYNAADRQARFRRGRGRPRCRHRQCHDVRYLLHRPAQPGRPEPRLQGETRHEVLKAPDCRPREIWSKLPPRLADCQVANRRQFATPGMSGSWQGRNVRRWRFSCRSRGGAQIDSSPWPPLTRSRKNFGRGRSGGKTGCLLIVEVPPGAVKLTRSGCSTWIVRD
ncbi:hypothetical protein [Bosea sp. CCNWLY174]|uniref:hypothetical protein n=1 Tax=unclassified Bosea (in: a-proteobacteria) TaxID=2653178 RepID=UPI003FA61348